MKRILAALVALAVWSLWPHVAYAQMTGVRVVTTCGNPAPWPALSTANLSLASAGWLTVDTNYNLCSYPPVGGAGVAGTVAAYIQGIAGGVPVPVSGSFAATISGWTEAPAGSRMTGGTVNLTDTTFTLPTGSVHVISNIGATNPMFCNAVGVAATTGDQVIPPLSWFAFTATGGSALHCIATGASTTVAGMGGSGIPTGAGGGGGGGGGGGLSVTDAATWTAGASNMTPIGCEFTTGGATPIVTAHQGSVGCNTNRALLVDPSGVTSPISAASLPLPANAAIATNQPTAILAAGSTTASTTATTAACAATTSAPTDTTGSSWMLSCNTSGGLRVDPSGVTSPISAASLPLPTGASTAALQPTVATAGNAAGTGTEMFGLTTTSAPTYTNAQVDPISLDTSGNIRVNCTVGCSASTNITQWATTALGASAVVNYGTTPAAAPVIGVNAFVTNANANGQSTMANSSPVAIASNQSALPVPAATATGGSNTAGAIAPNNTTAVVVKASAGTLYGVQLGGIGSVPAYLKIYNATSATCGSGTPVKRLIIPSASTAANGAGSNVTFGPAGVNFSTGITYCVTTGITDADATAPPASTYIINVDYQ